MVTDAPTSTDVPAFAPALLRFGRGIVMAAKKIIAPAEDADDDVLPRDIDEIRRALERRIRALIDAPSANRRAAEPKTKRAR